MTPIGHDANVAAVRGAAENGRLHHAWLLAGPEGVGKGLFARAAATWLLADSAGPRPAGPGFSVDPSHRIAALIAAGSHPDLRIAERLFRDKTGDHARNISIEQVRTLNGVFATTGSMSSRRIAIIDSIDDLETKAANALLKSLEEPPADGLFLLVTHAPGRLLPTIRSRCRLLRFGPLDDDAMATALIRAAPDLTPDERAALIRAGDGSPGRALRFAGLDIASIDAALDQLIQSGDPTNAIRNRFARTMATKAAQPRFEAFLDRAPSRFAAAARGRTGAALEQALDAWARVRGVSAAAVGLSLDPQTTVYEIASLAAGLAPAAGSVKDRA
ncbi:AAA family ATPase [Sphingomonas montana]|uniref:AAA family ATPase n=1 Tax=Sphingomonas montana TaxID=1843236 RepID=UPI00096F4FA3|nr:AAA family ATPase [Sphingomonas montana]